MMHQVLIVGAGSIGERHARCFTQIGRADAAVVEPLAARREALVGQYGWRAYGDLREALDQGGWSTVVVCTPAHTHVDVTLQCLDRGLSVLIEKPLAVRTPQVQPLLKRARQINTPAIGIAYVYRAHPAVAAVRQALRDGRFGRALQVVAVCGQHFPTFRPAYASTYYTRHETGGGAIQDALTHIINAVEWLVGPLTRLTADARHLKLPGVEVEDTVHLLARHGSVMANYALNQHQAPNETALTVICETGTVRIEMHQSRWRWQADPNAPWTDEPTPLASRDEWFERQAHAWLNVVEGKAQPLCSLREGLQTLAVNETALASAAADNAWRDVVVAPG